MTYLEWLLIVIAVVGGFMVLYMPGKNNDR